MKARHVNMNYEISNFEEMEMFLGMDAERKIDFILDETDYIENYINDTIEISGEDDNKMISREARDFLEDGIDGSGQENYEMYFTPYIDTIDMPSFVIYDKNIKEIEDDVWLIYINDDALDVYITQHFIQGIDNLAFPNMIIKLEDENGEIVDKPTYNISYLKTQLMGENGNDNSAVEKLEVLKRTMGFLLFRSVGFKMHNKISDKDIVMSDNNESYDYVFVYKLNSEWHVYGNNKKRSVYKADKFNHVIDWLGVNHAKHKNMTDYNPNYKGNISKVKTSLLQQRSKYLSDMKNRRKVQRAKGGENKKPVVQLDRDSGYAIQTWPSASDASKTLGISRTSITKVANGVGATAGGYGWKFA